MIKVNRSIRGTHLQAIILLALVAILCVGGTVFAQVLPPGSIIVQGEDFVSERGGRAEIVVRAGAYTFRQWDYSGHTLEWTFEVPEDGDYWLLFRYTCDGTPMRSLYINGERIGDENKGIVYPSTGSWQRWDVVVISTEHDLNTPMVFSLKKGVTTVVMENIKGGGLNVDYFAFIPVDSGFEIPRLTGFALIDTDVGTRFGLVSIPEPSASERKELVNKDYETAYELIKRRAVNSMLMVGEYFPVYAGPDGTWATDTFGWESGFWVGQLWRIYLETGDERWLDAAQHWNAWLLGREKADTHDLGFLFRLSSAYAYEVTGIELFQASALLAVENLKSRFNEASQLITAFSRSNDEHDTIIDTMMNLQLLLWAFEQTGNETYLDVVRKHALKTAEWLVREDGSTFQSVHFDPITGRLIKYDTHQGYNVSSTWSRGQAWGVYGFAAVYEAIREPEILETLRKMADWAIANAPEDHVPFYDYDHPEIPNTWKDTSAAAILCVGLLKLSEVEPDPARAEKYFAEAQAILDNLIRNYLAPTSEDDTYAVGGLKHGTYTAPDTADMELIFGNYYLTEALDLMLQRQGIKATDKVVLVDSCAGLYRVDRKDNGGYRLFADSLSEKGYFCTQLDLQGVLTPGLLDEVDVLILNNCGEYFYPAEIEAIHTFVQNGGGLLLIGNKDGNLSELNKVAVEYGFEFDDRSIGTVWTKPVVGGNVLDSALDNIEQIYFAGGSTFSINESGVQIVAEFMDNDGQYLPVAVAREVGKGRVVGIASPAIWTNEHWQTEGHMEFAHAIMDYLTGN